MWRLFDFIVYIAYTASKVKGKSMWTSRGWGQSQEEDARGFFSILVSTSVSFIFIFFLARFKILDRAIAFLFPNTDYVVIVEFSIFLIIWATLYILLRRHYSDEKIKEINDTYLNTLALIQARAIYILICLAFVALIPTILYLVSN